MIELPKDMVRVETVIPKDCIVCDTCNEQLSDSNFIAIAPCFWYKGWLYCDACNRRHKPAQELILVAEILKGADLSKTELALPIKVVTWERKA